MRRIISFATVLFLFIGCNPKLEEVVIDTHPDGSPKEVNYLKGKNKILVKGVYYYDNHTKRMEGEFKNEKRDGKWTAWYPEGVVWSEGWYKDGERDGKGIVYYENGQTYYSGNYVMGKQVGVWKFWNEDGTFLKTIDYGGK